MKDFFERCQQEGNPFVANIVRKAIENEGPLQGYIFLEAIRRLWILVVRYMSGEVQAPELYMHRPDPVKLRQLMQEKGLLDENRAGKIPDNDQAVQIFRLTDEFISLVMTIDFILDDNQDILAGVPDLLKDMIAAIEPIALSSILVKPGNDSDRTLEYRGASNWLIIKDDSELEGTALRTGTDVLQMGPALGRAGALLPVGIDGFFEDIEGNLCLKDGTILKLDGLAADQAALGKNMVFWGNDPTKTLKVLVEKGMDDAASAVAIWGGIYGDSKAGMDLMEAVTEHPQILTPAFRTLFDHHLRHELDTMLDRARTGGDDKSVIDLLMIKQSLESDPQKKTVILGMLATIYEEKLHNPEDLFYISCSIFRLEPSLEDGMQDLINQAEKLDKQEELADFLVEAAQDKELDNGLACGITTQAAVLFMEAELREKALNAASGAMGLRPATQDILSRLCGVFERLGDLELLKQCMEQKIATATTVGETIALYLDLGNLYKTRLNDREQALKYYGNAFQMAPDNDQVFNALSSELMEQGRVEELSGIYAKALGRTMVPDARARLLRGFIHITDEVLKDRKRTIGLLQELLILQPESGDEAHRLLELLMEEDDVDYIALGWKLAVQDKDDSLFERILKKADPLRQIWLIRAAKNEFPGFLEEELTALHDAGLAIDEARLLESVAKKTKGKEGSELYLRAAKIYEENTGLLEKAAICYEKAYELDPCEENVDKVATLYRQLGKSNELYLFLHENLEKVVDPDIQARMMGWMGEIAAKEMKDADVAIQYFDRSLDLVPTRFDLAEKLYDLLSLKGNNEKALVVAETAIETALQTHNKESVVRFTLLSGKASLQAGDYVKAIKYLEKLRSDGTIGPELLMALGKAYTITGKPALAKEVLQDVLNRFGQEMNAMDKATVLEELGDAAMGNHQYELALKLYLDSKKAIPGNHGLLNKALDAAQQAHEYYSAVDILEDIVYQTKDKDVQFDLLIKLGDMYALEIKDNNEAEKAYSNALKLKKDSRGVLHKLLKLYVETGEYGKTSSILTELLRIEEDGTKRAGYHYTAGMLALEHMDDTDEALKHFEQSLMYNPSNSKVLEMMIKILSEKDNDAVASLLKKQVETFRNLGDKTLELKMLEKLKVLYQDQMHNPVRTSEVMEDIAKIKGKNPDDLKIIADGYARVKSSMRRALDTYMDLLEMDPTRKEVYKSVRDLYRDMDDSDGYWSVCGVLSVLGLASPEESKFYIDHKNPALKLARNNIAQEDFGALIASRDEDSDVLKLLDLMWPAMRQALVWQQPSEVGITKNNIIDVNGSGAFETIYRVIVRLLGIKAPQVFLMPNVSGIRKAPFNPPAIVVGEDVHKGTRGKDLRFMLGQQLSLFTPGRIPFGVVDVQTLKSALTAVTKLSFPNFVIPEEAKEAKNLLVTLSKHITPNLDKIRDILSKIRHEHHRIDFEALEAAVDMTSNRMAFFMSDDISVALRNLKNVKAAFSNLQPADRIVDLTRYACSPEYISLRRLILKR